MKSHRFTARSTSLFIVVGPVQVPRSRRFLQNLHLTGITGDRETQWQTFPAGMVPGGRLNLPKTVFCWEIHQKPTFIRIATCFFLHYHPPCRDQTGHFLEAMWFVNEPLLEGKDASPRS